MTKMADMLMYGKNPLKYYYLDGIGTWYVTFGM